MANESDIKAIWKELDNYEKELDKESKSLQEIWGKITLLHSKTEEDIAKYIIIYFISLYCIHNNRLHALPELNFVNPSTEIRLNVGGQIFESTCEILTRDPYSILAACCRKDSPIPKCADGETFFIDRDWWLFRHILTYLRSNVLPRELETLRELYTESSFYRLECLKQAIEEMPVHEVISSNDVTSMSKSPSYMKTKQVL